MNTAMFAFSPAAEAVAEAQPSAVMQELAVNAQEFVICLQV